MEKNKIAWVQGLRGVAAVMVVFSHMRFYLTENNFHWVDDHVLYPGAMGVDLFFMVSGYIMALTTEKLEGTLVDARDFLAKRFARIWPVYAIISLLAVCTIHGLYYFPGHSSEIVRSLLFMPVSMNDPPYLGLPFGIGWTLNYEAYFYLIVGLALLFGKWRWYAFSTWIVLTLIAAPVLFGHAPHLDPRIGYGAGNINFILNPIIRDFAIGVFIALVVSKLRISGSRRHWTIAAAIVVTCCLAWNYVGPADFSGISLWGASLSILVFTLAALAKVRIIKCPKIIYTLGELSYSLYLTHLVVFSMMATIFMALGLDGTGIFFIVASAPLILLGAWISWALLEVRLSRRIRDALLRGSRTVPRAARDSA